MPFSVVYHYDVKNADLPIINSDDRDRIKRAIESRIMVAPHEYGIPLRKTLKGYWKLRVGDYRIVFKIRNKEIIVFCICHRKNVYKLMTTRQL